MGQISEIVISSALTNVMLLWHLDFQLAKLTGNFGERKQAVLSTIDNLYIGPNHCLIAFSEGGTKISPRPLRQFQYNQVQNLLSKCK